MRIAAIIFLSVCAVSVLSLADGEKPSATVTPASRFDVTTASTKPTTSPSNSTTPPSNSTTASTKPTTSPSNSTTPPSNSTTASTKPTTSPSNSTTPPSNSTTASTKPTTSPSNSTTAPTKPTTAPTHTTVPPHPQPTPPTSVTRGNYNVTNDQKQICLRAQMALQIKLSTAESKEVFIIQPNLTTAEGHCLETTANLTLRFKEGHITFLFNKNSTENKGYVSALSFVLHYPLIRNGSSSSYSANNKSLHLFAANVGHCYSCRKESLFMGNGLYLDVSEDRMQAFNLTKSADFGTPDHCSADQPDHRVAIAVGVTLLVLVVIVVVAYLLSRRRRTDGYQSL